MKKIALLGAIVALSLSTAASAQIVRGQPHAQLPEFLGWVQDEFVVVVEPEVRATLTVVEDAAGRPRASRASIQRLIDGQGVQRFARQFATARPRQAGSPLPDLTGHYKVRLGPGRGLDEALAAFAAEPDVQHVEPIGMHTLYGTPNDPYFEGSPDPSFPFDQWGLHGAHGIQAELAWDATTGDPDVVVGILDSGTRYYHVDLGGLVPQWGPGNPNTSGNIFVNPGEIPGNGIDDDGNGYVDDTIGWDFVASAGGGGVQCIDADCSGADNDPDDTNGHGTHTAGTVGAITNNGVLVAGVAGGFGPGAPGVKVLPLRIGYHARIQGFTTGVVRMDWAAEAMNYVADLVDAGNNVAAVNCSWGSSNSGGLNAAVDNLLAHDVMIVHAAGNAGSSSPDFLGNKAGVMNVAATDVNGNGASFSNHGSWVDVAAPGVQILSTFRNPDDPDPTAHYIAVLDGTSMAAPHVAGIAALLESCSPGLTGPQKFALITGNTNPYNDSRNLGSGIADAAEALAAASCSGTPCDITADFTASGTSGCAPLAVTFTNLSSGTIDTYAWDFGDGNGSSAANPSHTYAAAGTYSVSLTASSSTCSDAVTMSGLVTVSDVPVAAFDASPTSGSNPLTVSFTDLSGGNPTSWSWDFGDGNGSSAQNPLHAYTAAGTYTVSLSVGNACGADGATQVDLVTVVDVAEHSRVQSIVVTRNNLSQGFKEGVATVTVVDQDGSPVSGAQVTGDFTGKTTDLGLQATTGPGGQVVFVSSAVKGGGGEWCFEVTGVVASPAYDPGQNAVTQACEGGAVF